MDCCGVHSTPVDSGREEEEDGGDITLGMARMAVGTGGSGGRGTCFTIRVGGS